jgi:hypothetical protein
VDPAIIGLPDKRVRSMPQEARALGDQEKRLADVALRSGDVGQHQLPAEIKRDKNACPESALETFKRIERKVVN